MAERKRRGDRPGVEQARGSAETPESFTGAPDTVPHPGAGVGKVPDAADHETSGMNTTSGRGRGSGVAGGVAGGHGGTIVSDTNRAVGHEQDAGATGGGVAVPFGRGSNLGGAQGMASDIRGMSGGTLGGQRADDVAGIEQEQQPGLGGDMAQRPEDARAQSPADSGGTSPERLRPGRKRKG